MTVSNAAAAAGNNTIGTSNRSAAAALVSQDLFDETVLENQEVFDLSPSEAVEETIRQLEASLGPKAAGSSAASTTNDYENPDHYDKDHPPCLSHLVLFHPDSDEGRSERSARREFELAWDRLDSRVGVDGRVTPPVGNGGDGGNGDADALVAALETAADRCRSEGGIQFVRRTSSIYTLMSFLGVVSIEGGGSGGAANNDADEGEDGDEEGDVSKNGALLVIRAAARCSSAVLRPSRNNDNGGGSGGRCSSLRDELRDLFSPVLPRVANLLAWMSLQERQRLRRKWVSIRRMKREGRPKLESSEGAPPTQPLQMLALADLLRSSTDATRGCERGKLSFARSLLDDTAASELFEFEKQVRQQHEGAAAIESAGILIGRVGGGMRAVVSCLRIGNDDDNEISKDEKTNIVGEENEKEEASKSDTDFVASKVRTEACRLLACLCRYDDFRDQTSAGNPGQNISSAHDHAVEFHRAGALSPLLRILASALKNPREWRQQRGRRSLDSSETACAVGDERAAAAALSALRTLSVNDEIVQTAVALGVLPLAVNALRVGSTPVVAVGADDDYNGDEDDDNGAIIKARRSTISASTAAREQLAASALGLVRNLCGNDGIKTTLTLGPAAQRKGDGKGGRDDDINSSIITTSNSSALPLILTSMSTHPSSASVQEHALGTLAAMALRRPANALAIAGHPDGPRAILTAMRLHPDRVGVQRQGCLAVRNVVSRLVVKTVADGEGGSGSARTPTAASTLTEDGYAVREALLDLGAQEILRDIAGKHQGSVDEAYAALRDLGCPASLVRLDASDGGGGGAVAGKTAATVKVERTMMFGERHNSNFRPHFEESRGIDEAVSMAAHGESDAAF